MNDTVYPYFYLKITRLKSEKSSSTQLIIVHMGTIVRAIS